GRLRGGKLCRTQFSLRNSRTRYGRRPQWNESGQSPRLWFWILHLRRLHAWVSSLERIHGAPGDLCLHSRLDWSCEDGPTHQPIEQLAHMRAIPGLIVIRPADANEVREAWKVILQLHREPAVLALTRQALPTIDRKKFPPASGLARGAYILADAPASQPEVILIGTGSEVALCLEAYEQLSKEGVWARVVSMPSWELFDDQDKSYRDSVLPPSVKARVSVELASDFGWTKYTCSEGPNIGTETFGASAPLKQLLKKFGFNVENVVAAAKSQIARHGSTK